MNSHPVTSSQTVANSTMDRFRLDGRVCVVTGAARGIGFAIAQALQQAGGIVVLADLDLPTAMASAEQLGATAVEMDVTRPQSVDRALNTVCERHGCLDVLVNNAGVVKNTDAAQTDDVEWRTVMTVNLDGVFYCCRSAARFMLVQRRGTIVNIASMSGSIANRPQPQAAYNASKAAVIHLTRSLAAEWAPYGIRVNSLSPGYVATELTQRGLENDAWRSAWLDGTPLGRLAAPDEMGPGAVFLASDASSFMTGADLVMDGGYTAW